MIKMQQEIEPEYEHVDEMVTIYSDDEEWGNSPPIENKLPSWTLDQQKAAEQEICVNFSLLLNNLSFAEWSPNTPKVKTLPSHVPVAKKPLRGKSKNPITTSAFKTLDKAEKLFSSVQQRFFLDIFTTEAALIARARALRIQSEHYWTKVIKSMDGVVIGYKPSLRMLGGMPQGKGGKTKKKKGRPRPRANTNMGRPRNMSTTAVGQADSITITLRYQFSKLMNAVASSQTAIRFTANGAYDVDPVFGSTSMPGFAEYSALYSYNRVFAYKLSISVANLEAFPVSLYIVNSNTNPGTTGINYPAYSSNRFGQTHLLAASTAQPAKRLKSSVRVGDLFGNNKQVGVDSTFQGSSTANPSDLVYTAIGLTTSTGANLTNGVWVEGYLQMRIKFYDRKILTA